MSIKQMFFDRFPRAREAVKMGFHLFHEEKQAPRPSHGRIIFHMEDAETGEVLEHWEKDNIITLDAGIHSARLFKDPTEPQHGIYMLAVGTGATGALLSPDAPDEKQRRLNNEIARKTFSSTTFRDSSGVAVAYPTNIVDYSCTFGQGEAVGPLNEMGLIAPISSNAAIQNLNPQAYPAYDPTLDITPYDVQINYLTFSVISKPSTAILTITWRLTH